MGGQLMADDTYVPWDYLTITPLGGQAFTILRRTQKATKVSSSGVAEGGDIVRLANAKRRSLRRAQFRGLRKYTISGVGERKPPIDGLDKGDVIVVGLRKWMDLPGDVAEVNLPPHTAGSVRWLGAGGPNGSYVALEHGDAGVIATAFMPTLTIMLDDAPQVDDELQAGNTTWSLTGEMAG